MKLNQFIYSHFFLSCYFVTIALFYYDDLIFVTKIGLPSANVFIIKLILALSTGLFFNSLLPLLCSLIYKFKILNSSKEEHKLQYYRLLHIKLTLLIGITWNIGISVGQIVYIQEFNNLRLIQLYSIIEVFFFVAVVVVYLLFQCIKITTFYLRGCK